MRDFKPPTYDPLEKRKAGAVETNCKALIALRISSALLGSLGAAWAK